MHRVRKITETRIFVRDSHLGGRLLATLVSAHMDGLEGVRVVLCTTCALIIRFCWLDHEEENLKSHDVVMNEGIT
jgi:hypothetical protein